MRVLILAGALALLACGAKADPETSATLTVERHATSNALDGPFAFFDWYAVLRGGLDVQWKGDAGSLKLGAQVNARVHDTYTFEDDRAAGLVAVATRRLSPSVEVKGTVALTHASEGDDLLVEDVLVPIRTDTTTLSAAGEAGIDLGDGYALVLAALAAREEAGPTRLGGGLSAQLEADTTRLGASAALRRSHEGNVLGGEILWRGVRPEPAGGVIVAVGSDEMALKGELRRTLGQKVELRIVAGVGRFAAIEVPLEVVRPLYEATLKLTLGQAELRGSVVARFETKDSDDPLGSYVQRAQLEAGYRLSERLAAGAGLFLGLKENFLLGYDERSWGAYTEAAWTVSPKISLLFRVEYDRSRYEGLGMSEETLDAFVRVSAKT